MSHTQYGLITSNRRKPIHLLLLRRWPDLLFYLIMVVLSGYAIHDAIKRPSGEWSQLALGMMMLLMPIVTSVWLVIRLTPDLFALTSEKSSRQDLAITPIPASRVLLSALAPHALLATMAIWTLVPILLVTTTILRLTSGESLSSLSGILFLTLIVALAPVVISLAGLLVTLIIRCNRQRPGDFIVPLLTVIVIVLAGPIGIRMGLSSFDTFQYVLLLAGGMAAVAWLWRLACYRFYHFR